MKTYTDKFEYLARFYSPTITEEWRCRKYEGGLKHEFYVHPLIMRFMNNPHGVEMCFPALECKTRTFPMK